MNIAKLAQRTSIHAYLARMDIRLFWMLTAEALFANFANCIFLDVRHARRPVPNVRFAGQIQMEISYFCLWRIPRALAFYVMEVNRKKKFLLEKVKKRNEYKIPKSKILSFYNFVILTKLQYF